jgi:putative phosphoribosyl transferase
VLALPRGGLPVALPVAQSLGAPLDLLMVRKIGMPRHEELAAGAVVNGAEPKTVFNEDILHQTGLTEADFATTIESKLDEIAVRRARYLGQRPAISVTGCDAVVVDDGIATGATVRAALKGLRARGPSTITLAVPVAPQETLAELSQLVDHPICLATPSPFYAVGMHYHRFEQVSDDDVVRMLAEADQIRTKDAK